ncbi:MAG: hypothetical protein O3C39_04695 [Planctomycetota bacterium]|jgi:DNA/RNA endonuclease YhcR with UshA esterase domain|nr:hypothetical protein [Pirellulales bacterium]MDA0253330.1 hypothetical protein [Planctomycetota bacterium]MDA1200963.1 hypothetical protein [Planctomycetota bacterium]
MPPARLLLMACTLSLTIACATGRGDDAAVTDAGPSEAGAAEVISAAAAIEHIGEECIVEFTVKAGRKLDDKGICFLNSLRDHRESSNFTAVIFRAGLARFAAEGIENPALEYLELKVRVRGVIEEHAGKAQIVVESPTQIEIVDEDEADGAGGPVTPPSSKDS